MYGLELYCGTCGNYVEFIETTTDRWVVNDRTERQERIDVETTYICASCHERVYPRKAKEVKNENC
jgi:hypothetical protein